MRSLEQVNIRMNVRTYVRTYSHTYVRDRPYIPSTTLLCEGIINGSPERFNWPDIVCMGKFITEDEIMNLSKFKHGKVHCRRCQGYVVVSHNHVPQVA